MISGLLPKVGIGVLGLGSSSALGYGVYELARTKSIEEILSRSYKVLKTEVNDDDTEWKEVVEKYKEVKGNDNEPKKIDGFPTSSAEVTKEKLKSKCSELLKKSYVKEDDRNYLDSKNWCTNSLISVKAKE